MTPVPLIAANGDRADTGQQAASAEHRGSPPAGMPTGGCWAVLALLEQ